MARNTQVQADHNAHRTFLSWLGCALGANGHKAIDTALATPA